MNPKVSVIVLVYKAERYIERCARSLFGQTLEDMEYVFVDDCTPDSSMAVLEDVLRDYPGRAGQVKILHNDVNRGQAYSRRRGVEAASGDYIIHCDSDDWPESDMYARLYAKASEGDLDMVICPMRRVYPDHVEPVPDQTHTDDLLESLVYMDIRHYLLNKLISRKLYDAPVIWPENNMCEDTAISSIKGSMEKVEQIRANVELAISFLDSKGLTEKYRGAIMHLKCWAKFAALQLPRKYYLSLYPEANLPFFTDRRFTFAERLGHLTKILGIHGISKPFRRSR